MRCTLPVRRSLVVFAVGVLAACGGSESHDKSCSDACNNLFNCAAKLNFAPSDFLGASYATLSTCLAHCSVGTCPRQQELLNCAATAPCNNLSQVQTDAQACFTSTGCTP